MAIHLQDPFENKPTDTPMTTIAQGIEKNLVQLYSKLEKQPAGETHFMGQARPKKSKVAPTVSADKNNGHVVKHEAVYYVL